MGRVGSTRYIDFRVVDTSSNPVTGLHLADFNKYFTRDGVTCSDTVTLQDKGSGRYLATYVPSAAGFDFIELYNTTYDLRVQDAEQIDTVETFFGIGSQTVDLTQDYGGVGQFKVTEPSPVDWVLYIYKSLDWQAGRTDVSYAVTATNITYAGNWVTSPLTVLKDTYHVVIQQQTSGVVKVLRAFLNLTS